MSFEGLLNVYFWSECYPGMALHEEPFTNIINFQDRNFTILVCQVLLLKGNC